MEEPALKPEMLDIAREIVRTSLVWDNHACMPLRPEDHSFLPQLEDVRASGVNVISLNDWQFSHTLYAINYDAYSSGKTIL